MGRHDYVTPHVLWDEILPKLESVTYHLLEQSGHTPQLEEPKLFDQVLLEWLQKDSNDRDLPQPKPSGERVPLIILAPIGFMPPSPAWSVRPTLLPAAVGRSPLASRRYCE